MIEAVLGVVLAANNSDNIYLCLALLWRVHDCFIRDNFLIFYDCPCVLFLFRNSSAFVRELRPLVNFCLFFDGFVKFIGRNQGRLQLEELTIEVPKSPSCETPQALRGEVWGRVVPPPSGLGGLGSVVSFPSWVRGGAPGAYGFSTFRALYFA